MLLATHNQFRNVMFPSTAVEDCGCLLNITNGQVDLNPNTLQGSVATYTCNVGHELSGDATRTCQSLTGAWSGTEPTCNRKSAA